MSIYTDLAWSKIPYLNYRFDHYAGLLLENLLKDMPNAIPIRRVFGMFKFKREALIIMPGESILKRIYSPLCTYDKGSLIISTDSAIKLCLKLLRCKPDVIVTDLDGDVELMVKLNNESKCLVVVHAHGDNTEKLKSIVPKLKGPVIGTSQAFQGKYVLHSHGFTDGDRAIYLCKVVGIDKVILLGADFDRPSKLTEKYVSNIKHVKLGLAKLFTKWFSKDLQVIAI